MNKSANEVAHELFRQFFCSKGLSDGVAAIESALKQFAKSELQKCLDEISRGASELEDVKEHEIAQGYWECTITLESRIKELI